MEDTKVLAVPSVHLNGTGASTLLDEYEHAYRTVNDALEALRSVTVHGRDYYVNDPAGPHTYTQARDQHRARLDALSGVADELVAIYHAIRAQQRG